MKRVRVLCSGCVHLGDPRNLRAAEDAVEQLAQPVTKFGLSRPEVHACIASALRLLYVLPLKHLSDTSSVPAAAVAVSLKLNAPGDLQECRRQAVQHMLSIGRARCLEPVLLNHAGAAIRRQ